MTTFRLGEAADLIGVSVDTVRRWVDAGRLLATRDEHGHRVINGVELAAFLREQAGQSPDGSRGSSARNRLRGIVTAVVKDTVMAQVDIQAGPFRLVSLMSREAVDELDLRVGSVAVAVIKSTTVVVERSAPTVPHRDRTAAASHRDPTPAASHRDRTAAPHGARTPAAPHRRRALPYERRGTVAGGTS